MPKILTVLGTRPEAVKLSPVIRALKATPGVDAVVCATGQHRAILDQMLGFFGIEADHDLNLMRPNQTLTELTAAALSALQPVIARERPDWIVVQGDTTTAMAAALAGFYNKVRVAHVEAGLRTGDKYAPYPEEINRRFISDVADLHFAPTAAAAEALRREGHPPASVAVTGNTGIDALRWTLTALEDGRIAPPAQLAQIGGRRLVLVTAHRRENFDAGMEEICGALTALTRRFDDIVAVLPVHPNPNVKGPIERMLTGVDRVLLTAPIDYGPFVGLLGRAALILTDSGGIQEEATALGKPMLVMRDVTERPEAVKAGCAKLVGAHKDRVVDEATILLSDPEAYARMARPSDVFGDGHAAERIAAALKGWPA